MTDALRDAADEGQDLTAAEYVLGVQTAPERAAAQARLAAEPAFAHEVGFWEGRLTPLAQEVPPITPPARVWERIVALLPANQDGGLWNSLKLWRGLTAGAAALAAASLVIAVLPRTAPPAPTPAPVVAPAPRAMVAVLALTDAPEGHAPAMIVTLDRAGKRMMLNPADMTLPQGVEAQLWIVPPAGDPHSLGVIAASGAQAMDIPDMLTHEDAGEMTLAVSLEPPGGSPTGLPTGPIVASGRLQAV